MRRTFALLTGLLLLVAVAPAAGVSAADTNHVRLTRTGAIVSFAEVHDGLWVFTELSASSEASRTSGTSPLVWINQGAYALDENGEYNILVWTRGGSTTDFSMTIGTGLASAVVSVPAMPVDVCDADFNCTQATAAIDASFTAFGPTLHSHQRSIGAVSRQSLFVYNNVGTSRFATASVAVDGVTYGPSTGPSDATIYDTKTGTMDVTYAPVGTHAALPAGVTIFDTTETPTGRSTGESMFAIWSSESGGIGRFTVLSAASQQVNTKGMVVNRVSVGYADQVYAVDEFGNQTPISYTEGFGDSATTILVDRTLSVGNLAGAVIPVNACTYVGDEVLCVATTVNASGTWTGVGSTTKTRDGSTAGTAGQLVIVYHNVSTHRGADATATIDGDPISGATEAALDRSTTGFHEVHLGG